MTFSEDATKIYRDLGIQCAGIVEIKEIVPPEAPTVNGKQVTRGLAWYVGHFLGRKLMKAKTDQLSDWGQVRLTPRQKACESPSPSPSSPVMSPPH